MNGLRAHRVWLSGCTGIYSNCWTVNDNEEVFFSEWCQFVRAGTADISVNRYNAELLKTRGFEISIMIGP